MGQVLAYGFTLVLSCLYAELVGYFLHRLLHSELVPWLSRRHLAHHVELYGPQMKMRTATYLDGEARGGIGGVGWEWILPSLGMFVIELLVLVALGVPAAHQAILYVGGLVWSVVMFHRAHEAMHVSAPSMFLTLPLRRWFLHARGMHDIHHLAVNDAGRFEKNFGIALHWFDRLLGTYQPRLPSKRAKASPRVERSAE